MSTIQIASIIMLFFADVIFNLVGWIIIEIDTGYVHPILLFGLVLSDIATVVVLVLGAFGVFG